MIERPEQPHILFFVIPVKAIFSNPFLREASIQVKIRMGKIKTVEIVIRGDIIEKNIILKLASMLQRSGLRADFSSSIAVPPFLMAVEKRYPSVAVLYVTVDLEDLFQFKALIDTVCTEEDCLLLSFMEL